MQSVPGKELLQLWVMLSRAGGHCSAECLSMGGVCTELEEETGTSVTSTGVYAICLCTAKPVFGLGFALISCMCTCLGLLRDTNCVCSEEVSREACLHV